MHAEGRWRNKNTPMKHYLVGFLLFFYSWCAFAQDTTKKDAIDRAMEAEMEKDPSTAGMVRAISNANVQWDKKMNSIYRSLKKKMAPDEWKSLVAAQQAWINYRDLQTMSIESTYSKMEGTMWVPVSVSRVMEITKARTLFLESLLENISER
jgi:uncharacterized protein YecT (DUF1311 family)